MSNIILGRNNYINRKLRNNTKIKGGFDLPGIPQVLTDTKALDIDNTKKWLTFITNFISILTLVGVIKK